jgi:hypothetical protein
MLTCPQQARAEHTTLRTICKLDIPSAVPLQGTITFTDLAAKTNLDPTFLSRIIRAAATSHFFIEGPQDTVRHSAASAAIAADPVLRSHIVYQQELCQPAVFRIAEAARKYGTKRGESQEITETGFNVEFKTERNYWEWLALKENEWGRKAFDDSMKFHGRSGGTQGPAIAKMAVWKGLKRDTKIVDVSDRLHNTCRLNILHI